MINVLYVEDDANSRQVLKMVERINPEMFSITIYEDSANFEDKVLGLETLPDIIFLDIHVAPYTGFEMLTMIRNHDIFDNTPVVALTASVMSEEIELLKNAGFQSVLSKPIDLDQFPELVNRILTGEIIWYVE